MTAGVVFVEEPSAAIIISALAQTLGVASSIRVIPHEGRSDLCASYPRKIAAWRYPDNVRFLIVHDNDGGDCMRRKQVLRDILPKERLDRCRIRIVMQELESWYLGEPEALMDAGVIDSRSYQALRHRKFLDPDAVSNPKSLIKRHVKIAGQIELADMVGPHLQPERNRSASLQHVVGTLRWLVAT